METDNIYEKQVQRVNPTYPQLFSMALTYLSNLVPEAADLLIIGAGGGQELVTFGQASPKWSLTGIDPAYGMIEMARQRVESVALSNRIHLFHGIVEDLPQGQYDAATSLLVLHFLSEDEKISMLQAIYQNLKPGAPFILASLVGTPGSFAYGVHLAAWVSHMAGPDATQDALEVQDNILRNQWHLISEGHLYELLKNAGFINVDRYYYSYLFGGWIAFKPS